MIALTRPSLTRVAAYLAEQEGVAPTGRVVEPVPGGFRHDTFTRVVGIGPADLARARAGLEAWAAHRGSGVAVAPDDAPVAIGTDVAITTRQLGLWVLAACRVVAVVDELDRFGFTYATLPGHPAAGHESFLVALEGDEVVFRIDAVSRPGVLLTRLSAPLAKVLQRRATEAYLTALEQWVADHR